VIDRLESERAHRDRLKLEVVAWDKPGAGTAMPAQMEPQEAINRGLKKPSECDIVIVIFWARMGTLLSEKYLNPGGSRYRSGTEYEFLDAFHAAKKSGKPDVLVYRRKDPPDLKLRDPERKEKERQWELVEEFFAEFRNPDGSFKSYYKEYDEPSDFEKLLGDDLRDIITRYLDSHPPDETEVAPTPVTQKPSWEASPFPGLRAFRPDEALIFHGRGREIDSLINKLSSSENRFIAVVGASGSGKSSLVAAGLLPAIEKDAIHGSKDWVWGRFTPGELSNNPFIALTAAFKQIIEKNGQTPRDTAAQLEKNPGSFSRFFEMVLKGKPGWAELLLFIDQFEELFTLVDKKYQGSFVELLALTEKTTRMRTVVTMRADFYHRCLQWPVLDALIAKGHYPLLAPGTGALHEMITGPAERNGFQFETGLVQRILDETGTEPGALALMAYALSELWQASKGGGMMMTHAAYDSFNGVRGAIGKRAEDTFIETLEALKLGVNCAGIVLFPGRVDDARAPGYTLLYSAEGHFDDVAAELSIVRVTLEKQAGEVTFELVENSATQEWQHSLEPAAILRAAVPPRNLSLLSSTANLCTLEQPFLMDITNGCLYLGGLPEQVTAQLPPLQQAAGELDGYAVLAAGPRNLFQRVGVWGKARPARRLMQSLKLRWDPGNILNRSEFIQ